MNTKFDVETGVWEGVQIPYNLPSDVQLNEIVDEQVDKNSKKNRSNILRRWV